MQDDPKLDDIYLAIQNRDEAGVARLCRHFTRQVFQARQGQELVLDVAVLAYNAASSRQLKDRSYQIIFVLLDAFIEHADDDLKVLCAPSLSRILELALYNDDHGLISKAVRAGADINAPLPTVQYTPLGQAIRWKNRQLARHLMSCGANPRAGSGFHTSCIEYCRTIGAGQRILWDMLLVDLSPVDLRNISDVIAIGNPGTIQSALQLIPLTRTEAMELILRFLEVDLTRGGTEAVLAYFHQTNLDKGEEHDFLSDLLRTANDRKCPQVVDILIDLKVSFVNFPNYLTQHFLSRSIKRGRVEQSIYMLENGVAPWLELEMEDGVMVSTCPVLDWACDACLRDVIGLVARNPIITETVALRTLSRQMENGNLVPLATVLNAINFSTEARLELLGLAAAYDDVHALITLIQNGCDPDLEYIDREVTMDELDDYLLTLTCMPDEDGTNIALPSRFYCPLVLFSCPYAHGREFNLLRSNLIYRMSLRNDGYAVSFLAELGASPIMVLTYYIDVRRGDAELDIALEILEANLILALKGTVVFLNVAQSWNVSALLVDIVDTHRDLVAVLATLAKNEGQVFSLAIAELSLDVLTLLNAVIGSALGARSLFEQSLQKLLSGQDDRFIELYESQIINRLSETGWDELRRRRGGARRSTIQIRAYELLWQIPMLAPYFGGSTDDPLPNYDYQDNESSDNDNSTN